MPRTPANILIVEDESDISKLMGMHLARDGHKATIAADGETGQKLLAQNPYDLAILDWMLPGVSGLQLCKELNRRIPVLMVTARADAADIVLGLEMGADDYITKPFEIPVFLARVRALLRRAEKPAKDRNAAAHSLGGLAVNVPEHKVSCDGQAIPLTISEFKLLLALLENRGRVLSRDALVRMVQGEGVNVTGRTIDTHVFGLRKKLGMCAEVIETIRGVGYRVKAD